MTEGYMRVISAEYDSVDVAGTDGRVDRQPDWIKDLLAGGELPKSHGACKSGGGELPRVEAIDWGNSDEEVLEITPLKFGNPLLRKLY